MRSGKKRPGFTLVELLVVMAILGVVAAILLPAIGSVRESARRTLCKNKIKQVVTAAINYESANGEFPPGVVTKPYEYDLQKAMHSGYAFLLPFFEEIRQSQAYDFKSNWSDPANKSAQVDIDVLRCPSNDTGVPDASGLRRGACDYAFCKGAVGFLCIRSTPDYDEIGIFEINSNTKTSSIVDGLSFTFAIGEAASNVHWKAKST